MIFFLRRRGYGKDTCRELASVMSHDVSVIRNTRVYSHHRFPQDTVIRWGCTTPVNARYEINTSQAIHQVNDKMGFRRVLNEHELCPLTTFSITDLDPWGNETDQHCYPVMVRPRTHARGIDIYICQTRRALAHTCHQLGEGNYYISELINKTAEYRVFIAQGRVLSVAKKIPEDPEAVAWNHAAGASFENVRWDQWPLRAVRVSVEAFNLSSLDFGAIDVIVGQDNRAYVLEINTAPALESEYRTECLAKAFDYMLDNGKERIPLVEQRGGYRKFIHPAICERALV